MINCFTPTIEARKTELPAKEKDESSIRALPERSLLGTHGEAKTLLWKALLTAMRSQSRSVHASSYFFSQRNNPRKQRAESASSKSATIIYQRDRIHAITSDKIQTWDSPNSAIKGAVPRSFDFRGPRLHSTVNGAYENDVSFSNDGNAAEDSKTHPNSNPLASRVIHSGQFNPDCAAFESLGYLYLIKLVRWYRRKSNGMPRL